MLIPWNVGTIPMWAALASLEDTDAMRKRVEFNSRAVRYIEGELEDIPGLVIFHSRGNYILFDGAGAGKKGKDVVEYARRKGVILRPQPEMYGSVGFFRVTIGLEDENRLAVQAIKEFFSS
jgi:histidinol-phosphate/aromatic aminotransferase/cobyric acid decarboxylase-like protein